MVASDMPRSRERTWHQQSDTISREVLRSRVSGAVYAGNDDRVRCMIMAMSLHVMPQQNEVHDNGDVTTCDPPNRMRCMIMVMSLHVIPSAE